MTSAAGHQFPRARQLERLARETFDLAVIGAGINGAAIARDAAVRGLKVALIDKGDFAIATSSRSSKLIHGGIRYLPQRQLRLVYHALRERERLRWHTAPHLVGPARFLFPIYESNAFGPLALRIGLILYDLFARPIKAERHRMLRAAQIEQVEPRLSRKGLRGGAIFYDGFADDARLTLENALDAQIHGAAVANYVALSSFAKQQSRLGGAMVKDQISGDDFEIRARMFVNATGPWVDDIRRLDDPSAGSSVRLTRGAHLVFSAERLPARNWMVLDDGEGRIVFVMPQGRYVLVGTTDTDFAGDRDLVHAGADDIAYLLRLLNQAFGLTLGGHDVLSSFAGLRALLVGEEGAPPSAVPREETIIRSISGLVSVAGGKLTTHRQIAEKVTDLCVRELGITADKCRTKELPLPGARPAGDDSALASMDASVADDLRNRYGTRAAQVAALIASGASSEILAPRLPVIAAEVLHAIRSEMALRLADFIVRRTSMVWKYPLEAKIAAPAVARIMAEELNWTPEQERAELEAFVSDFKTRCAA